MIQLNTCEITAEKSTFEHHCSVDFALCY